MPHCVDRVARHLNARRWVDAGHAPRCMCSLPSCRYAVPIRSFLIYLTLCAIWSLTPPIANSARHRVASILHALRSSGNPRARAPFAGGLGGARSARGSAGRTPGSPRRSGCPGWLPGARAAVRWPLLCGRREAQEDTRLWLANAVVRCLYVCLYMFIGSIVFVFCCLWLADVFVGRVGSSVEVLFDRPRTLSAWCCRL